MSGVSSLPDEKLGKSQNERTHRGDGCKETSERGNRHLERQVHLLLVEITASISVKSAEGDGDAKEVGVEGSPKTKHAVKLGKGRERGKSQNMREKRMLRTEGKELNEEDWKIRMHHAAPRPKMLCNTKRGCFHCILRLVKGCCIPLQEAASHFVLMRWE